MIKMEVEIFPWDSLIEVEEKGKERSNTSPNMNTITIDYFGMIPNDILHIILSFIDSFKASFSLLLVSKRFYHLVKPNQLQWKVLCLQFWKEYKQLSGWNYYLIKGEYDLEWAQRESGKDWFWFSQCFTNGRVYKGEYSTIICIGPTPGKEWHVM